MITKKKTEGKRDEKNHHTGGNARVSGDAPGDGDALDWRHPAPGGDAVTCAVTPPLGPPREGGGGGEPVPEAEPREAMIANAPRWSARDDEGWAEACGTPRGGDAAADDGGVGGGRGGEEGGGRPQSTRRLCVCVREDRVRNDEVWAGG